MLSSCHLENEKSGYFWLKIVIQSFGGRNDKKNFNI